MQAKYPTTCAVCGQKVNPGDEIARAGSGWGHQACAAKVSEVTVTRVAPSGTAPSSPASSRPTRESASPFRTGRTARPRPADMVAAEGALEVWTDGACSGNPGPGGWAWATRDGRQGTGGESGTTNQRMEISAALHAVQALEGPLVVVSDSTYVVNCFRDQWWKGWLERGWVNSQKKPVANRDLWEPLITAFQERGDISFRWVKGHSGDEMNDLVDRLAVEAGKNQA